MITQKTLEQALSDYAADEVYFRVSESTVGALWRYAVQRVQPGGFLTALLGNDLREAFARADGYNTAWMKAIIQLCYMELPATSWGTRERVQVWLTGGEP